MKKLRHMYFASLNWLSSLSDSLLAKDYDGYSRINRHIMLAWLAIFGFPIYYWMWTDLFPQPYENLPLRLIGVALAIPLLLARRLHREKWFNVYFYVVLTYAFPFFFTFMFLMNEGSAAWSQSLLIAAFIMLHMEGKNALISAVCGTGCAYLAYMSSADRYFFPAESILVNTPIIFFGIVAVSIVKVSRHILAEQKLHGMASALGTVSHELRTPLLSVGASASGLKRYLPALITFYKENNGVSSADALSPGRLKMMEAAVERIQAEVQHMNSAIDLLLANSRAMESGSRTVQRFQINEMIHKAIARYPFENDAQAALVRVDLRTDFEVDGYEDLGIMVIFNLLKNALRAIARAGKGEIEIITTVSFDGEHRLVFRDTGCGIPAREIPHVFRRFYSYPSNVGSGIGLAFCREALAAWGAKISCRSIEGRYTEFVIQFRDAEKS